MLKKVENILGSNLIRTRNKTKNKQAYDIRFNNKTVAATLKKYGLHATKSLTIDWPINLDERLEWDFIRGVFDGDGCMYVKNKTIGRFSICSASSLFINKIQAFFKKNDIDMNITTNNSYRDNTLYNIATSKFSYIEKIYENFYYDGSLQLDRKKEKFEIYLNAERRKAGRPKSK
jgi:intein/homing endonuclease